MMYVMIPLAVTFMYVAGRSGNVDDAITALIASGCTSVLLWDLNTQSHFTFADRPGMAASLCVALIIGLVCMVVVRLRFDSRFPPKRWMRDE